MNSDEPSHVPRWFTTAPLPGPRDSPPPSDKVEIDFGARSRDWGWHPKVKKDVWDWFEDAIALVFELTSDADARALAPPAREPAMPAPGRSM